MNEVKLIGANAEDLLKNGYQLVNKSPIPESEKDEFVNGLEARLERPIESVVLNNLGTGYDIYVKYERLR